MTFNFKIAILGAITFTLLLIIIWLKPIPQDLAFHAFADARTMLGLHNFFNVLSNIPFLIVGTLGLLSLTKHNTKRPVAIAYGVIFIGIILTGIGSGYYHYFPDNYSLVFDRIPMTIVFMSFLSITITECIDAKIGNLSLWPLLMAGIGSVLWWHFTELKGNGDLRPYVFVQFYPMLIVSVIFILFPSSTDNKVLYPLIWAIVWYIVAKVFEKFDAYVFKALYFISGHSLKHIAAAVATYYILKFYRLKYRSYSNSE